MSLLYCEEMHFGYYTLAIAVVSWRLLAHHRGGGG